MKKSLGIIAVLLLSVLAVHAQGYGAAQERGNASLHVAEPQDVKLTGLQNAMVRVRDNETRDHLVSVWARIQEKRDNQTMKLENKEVREDASGNITVEGDYEAKLFGFIPSKKHYQYVLADDGSVTRLRGPFDWMFSIPKEAQ